MITVNGVAVQKRQLGKTSMNVSVLGFGGAEIGYEAAEQLAVDRMLNAALDSGVNVIDTAECYIDSEERIGKAVSHRRGEYYLFSKCGHASGLPAPDWSADLIMQSAERSLRRLRTDYLDLLQLHSCSADVLRQGEVVRCLQDLKTAGKTRYIGYSGDGDDAMFAIETGTFDTLQTSVNIADQQCIDTTVPAAAARGMGVIAKRPIANAVWKYGDLPSNGYYHEYWRRLKQIDYLFLRANLTEAVGTALRFTLSVPGVTCAIVGTKSEERWRENLELVQQPELPKEQFEAIRTIWRDRASPDWVGQV
jgi:aryl-alcohol dehydrogenase-like predicted oxidoreductase